MSVVVLVINEIRKHPILALIGAIGAISVPILAVAIIVTVLMSAGSDDDDCDSGNDSGTVDANFSMTGGSQEKQFLKWCGQQHLNAAQTAGLAGNAIVEAGGWNGSGNYWGVSYPGTQSGEKGTSSSENVANYLNWTVLHKGHQKYSALSECPSAFKKYQGMKSKSPYELAGWWCDNVLHTQQSGAAQTKGNVARQVYKQISGGHSSVSSDTSSTAGSSQQTSNSGSQVSGNTPAAQIYNFFVSKEHFSAAAAAGVCAIAQRESGANTSSPDPSSISPKAGNGSHTGIFQWTSDRLHSGGFIKSSGDETISNELKVADYELHHDKKNVLSDVGKMTNPAKAAEKWSVEYEGVSLSDGQTKRSMIDSIADGYYKKYQGMNPGDDSSSGSSCDDSGDSNSADGTGSIKEQPSGVGNEAWKPSQVPSDVKQYIHNPSSAGMSYGNSKGWSNKDDDGGQCVPFANSFFQAIWGIHGHPSVIGGKDAVGDWHNYLPGSTVSTTPHAGAIASSTNQGFTAGNSYGHTFVVEHVFSNGNYLIAEENWPGKSGSHIGKMYTWNYALIRKGVSNTKFCMPPSKYKLKW